jgi:superfamily I DNA/RNA helicase
MSKEEAQTIAVFNYHAFYFDILRKKAGLWKSAATLRPASVSEHKDYLQSVLENAGIDRRSIQKAKAQASLVYALQRFDLKDLLGNAEESLLDKDTLQIIYNGAVDQLRNGRPHYDDFAPLFLNLLECCPEIVEWMQLVYPVVILDEIQDTDLLQQQILFALHPKRLAILYDRYQMIYEWRGARVDTISKTTEEFRFAKESSAELTRNHRSGDEAGITQFILQLRADNLRGEQLVDFKHRKWLTLQPVQRWRNVLETNWQSISAENKCLTQLRNSHFRNGYLIDYKETTAILTRNNYLAKYLYDHLSLKKGNAPYYRCRWIGSDNNFDEKIRDHVWRLRAVNGDSGLRVWLGRLLDDMLPQLDYLKEVSFQKEFALSSDKVLAHRKKDVFKSAKENIAGWLDSIEVSNFQLFAHGLQELLVVAGKLLAENGHLDPDVTYFVRELAQSVGRLAAGTASRTWNQLCDYFEDDLVRASYLRLRHPPNGLYISTIHQSKGREFDHVIIPWLAGKGEPSETENGGRYPHSYDFDNFEDRRLLYVAFTRARHRVTIIYPKEDPSPFIHGWRLV